MKCFYIVIATALLISVTNSANSQTKWKTLTHSNGFTIQLPSYFKKGLLVAAGTFQYFDNSIHNQISVSVESFGNGTNSDLKFSFNDDLKSHKGIIYQLFKRNWYVISGQNEDGIFYNKSIIKNGVQHHLRITYPINKKVLFDTILKKISSSFS